MNLLQKTRRLNRLLQKTGGNPVSFAEMAETLKESLSADVYIISRKGKVLGQSLVSSAGLTSLQIQLLDQKRVPEEHNRIFSRIEETASNDPADQEIGEIPTDLLAAFNHKHAIIVPVMGGGERLGTLLMLRDEEPFNDEDLVLAEYGATIVSIEIMRVRASEMEESARQRAVVQVAVSSLSFSELEAVEHIFEELKEKEGLLVASKIADRVGITRSVIVNALRKLESAGVIETRSLGMKGTYIKILNDLLVEELKKARL